MTTKYYCVSSQTGTLRIIGGCWRGRKLSVANNKELRPTPNRVRETLFNWLSTRVNGSRCLDCFAGSGALSIEALSRDANRVVLLEKDFITSTLLKKNIQSYNTKRAHIINVDCMHWLAKPGEPFDIVFIDPPFGKGLVEKTIDVLEKYHRLAPNASIYIETESTKCIQDIPTDWKLYRYKIAGRVAYRLYFRLNYITKQF